MQINTVNPLAQYHSIANTQFSAEPESREDGNVLPPDAVVVISSDARDLMERDSNLYNRRGESSSRALAYGELNYGGPPTLSLEEVSERYALWSQYKDTSIMDAFKQDLINLYEKESSRGTPDALIGEKLIELHDEMHAKLVDLEKAKQPDV